MGFDGISRDFMVSLLVSLMMSFMGFHDVSGIYLLVMTVALSYWSLGPLMFVDFLREMDK